MQVDPEEDTEGVDWHFKEGKQEKEKTRMTNLALQLRLRAYNALVETLSHQLVERASAGGLGDGTTLRSVKERRPLHRKIQAAFKNKGIHAKEYMSKPYTEPHTDPYTDLIHVKEEMSKLGFDLSPIGETFLNAIIADGSAGIIEWKSVSEDVERLVKEALELSDTMAAPSQCHDPADVGLKLAKYPKQKSANMDQLPDPHSPDAALQTASHPESQFELDVSSQQAPHQGGGWFRASYLSMLSWMACFRPTPAHEANVQSRYITRE